MATALAGLVLRRQLGAVAPTAHAPVADAGILDARLATATAIDSLVGGVRLGGQSYSFRELTRPVSAGSGVSAVNLVEAVNTVIRA